MTEGRYVSLTEAKEMLEKESELRELSPDQKAAHEHASKVTPLSFSDIKALIDEVAALDFVNDFVAVKIADVLPQHPDDVRAVFAKERMVLEKGHIDQIIDIVVKYL